LELGFNFIFMLLQLAGEKRRVYRVEEIACAGRCLSGSRHEQKITESGTQFSKFKSRINQKKTKKSHRP